MTQKVTLYRIFVASPSDVKDERETLEEIINELNLSALTRINIRVELLKWETHVNPGIGDYPQQVINEDIGKNYDIFLGILWSKFGTPTNDFNSGTEEEFYTAYGLHQKNPETIKIMIYFKTAAVPFDKIDTNSIDSIRRFKDDLKKKNVLFWEYTTIEELQSLLRIQLSRQILELNDKSTNKTQNDKSPVIVEPTEDEFGVLDYLGFGEECFLTVQEILGRITTAMNWMSKRFIEKTQEIQIQSKINPQISTSLKKHLIDSTANDMEIFVKRVEVEIPLFADTFKKGIENFSSGLKISMELKADKKEDIIGAIDSFEEAKTAMIGAKTAFCTFRDTIINFPNITQTFNRAKRLAYSALDKIIKEYDIAINLTDALLSEFKEYQNKY